VFLEIESTNSLESDRAAIETALRRLSDRLTRQLQEVAKTKLCINQLHKELGNDPLFSEAAADPGLLALTLHRDQFYGMLLATAVQTYLKLTGHAADTREIADALIYGGFDFDGQAWAPSSRLRELTLSLGKNTKTFVRLKNGAFGLTQWYDDKHKPKKTRRRIRTSVKTTGPTEGGSA
jgi:hypothetical protein